MIFGNQSVFARFLIQSDYQVDDAIKQFKEHIRWRKLKQINQILDNEEIDDEKIKLYMPNTFHFQDDRGRPMWVFQMGKLRLTDLLQSVSEVTLE